MSADRSADPNFPTGLRIHPSSLNRSNAAQKPCQTNTELSSTTANGSEQAASWEHDTAKDIDDYGIAGRIWEAAYLLARYLRPSNQEPGELQFDPPCSLFSSAGTTSKPLTVVELGSGAGYGSLHLARQLVHYAEAAAPPKLAQARLVLTDLENVVPLMERNVERAGYKKASETINVSVRGLAWGNEEHASRLLSELSTSETGPIIDPLTHILCSDLVYFPELLPPLLRSIISLSSYGLSNADADSSQTRGPELIISYKIRSLTKEQPFWSALGSWFDFQTVDCRSIPRNQANSDSAEDDVQMAWHRFGSQGQDCGASADADQELFVFVGHRRKETFGCLAPESNADLMQGKRLRRRKEQGEDGEDRFELETPSSGTDYFEWLLLSNMGAGLG